MFIVVVAIIKAKAKPTEKKKQIVEIPLKLRWLTHFACVRNIHKISIQNQINQLINIRLFLLPIFYQAHFCKQHEKKQQQQKQQ